MFKPTLLELDNKLIQAKYLCYNNSVELYNIDETEKFLDDLFNITKSLNIENYYINISYDYLGTINKDYQKIFEECNHHVWHTFFKIRKIFYEKKNNSPNDFLQAYNSGNFIKCFELLDKF